MLNCTDWPKVICSEKGSGHTLQTTALINEAYLRLIDWKNVRWQGPRSLLRGRRSIYAAHPGGFRPRAPLRKRGGGAQQISLDEAVTIHGDRSAELIALDEALKGLAEIDPRKSQIVELRFFGGAERARDG